ncbi:flagellar biosynthesis protein FlhF [Lacipirellula parvula]|uniref:Flagellar biosynthesis protein FlhF n=1 Tax=Lacipirellula parvula TaxID=2650471 RepID=A0A5K7XB83_9BACT|nr:flagellar biosynthesis protein FlhF [Lacipirellula parvula]BBO34030.1 flagellar biosynthesis protein FlhF [Lacipirellula parvula]
MDIKTFRAKTMPQALDLVRQELGPEAMVLHTRERHASLLGRLFIGRSYEIAATHVERETSPPSQGGARGGIAEATTLKAFTTTRREASDTYDRPHSTSFDAGLDLSAGPSPLLHPPTASPQIAELESLLTQLRARQGQAPRRQSPPALFNLFTDLIEAEVEESVARELVDGLRNEPAFEHADSRTARHRLAQLLQSDLRVTGPIDASSGSGRVVALVGPTGVGKTTTIAKLAANYRLKEGHRVGLITVDTYRIAAVEQLRTYAEIIDLPMEVVSTPREMREAVAKMRDFDLVLMDTAGRSPRDEVRIRELRTMLAEAEPDEVHLVLSAASSARSLVAAAEKFIPVGVTAAIVTKIDEATALGNVLSLARRCDLPFSYLTDGQNVPDDISVAEARTLANLILNVPAAA